MLGIFPSPRKAACNARPTGNTDFTTPRTEPGASRHEAATAIGNLQDAIAKGTQASVTPLQPAFRPVEHQLAESMTIMLARSGLIRAKQI